MKANALCAECAALPAGPLCPSPEPGTCARCGELTPSAAPVAADFADVPLCPELHKGRRCDGPLVTKAEHRYPSAYPESVRLVCLACGEGREGTEQEVERAQKARAAWVARGRQA